MVSTSARPPCGSPALIPRDDLVVIREAREVGTVAVGAAVAPGAFVYCAPTMTISVFVGTSVDGFIARRNGEFDFLPADGGEPHGYDEFMATVDALVIGRNTFETVLKFAAWPYGDKRVVVLSSRPVESPTPNGGVVEHMSGDPAEIVARLASTGAHHLYVDGGITIQQFLRAGLVHRLIVTRVPVLIGDGIPLFGSVPHDVRLEHVMTRSYPSGLVQSEYRVSASSAGAR